MSHVPMTAMSGFLTAIAEAMGAERTLQVNASDRSVLQLARPSETTNSIEWQSSLSNTSPFDLVAVDLPFGLGTETLTLAGTSFRVRKSWITLTRALEFLDDGGMCAALLEPTGLASAEGPRLQSALGHLGYSLAGYFDTPEGTLLPHTSVRPVIAVFVKGTQEDVFLAQLQDPEQAESVARAFVRMAPGRQLSEGILMGQDKFAGFGRLRAEQQLSALQSQYKEYESVRLGDIAHTVTAVRSGALHQEMLNSVYIPMLGTTQVTADLDAVTLKHHNVLQVGLSDQAEAAYVAAFFQSEIGQVVLLGLRTGNVIAKIRKQDIAEARIALPKIAEQRQIASTHTRLATLVEAVAGLRQELAVNPRSAAAIQDQLESMLERIGSLSDTDKVMSLVRDGESKTVEFKQSLSVDLKKGSRATYVETAALKTIAAFLNSDGGWLLVGVSDVRDTVGVDDEIARFSKGQDGFLLHVKNLIKDRIGAQFYPFINHRLVSIGDRHVLLVECRASSTPCYVDVNDFYVRTNPATDKLQGPQLVEYIKNHFDQ